LVEIPLYYAFLQTLFFRTHCWESKGRILYQFFSKIIESGSDMNRNWQTFLTTRALHRDPDGDLHESADPLTVRPAVVQTSQYSMLAVTGRDAATFLQGQTTCDVVGLQNDRATPGAVCNPKGRVFATFMLFIHENGFRLLLPQALTPAVEKRLRMFVLRSQVRIENITDSVAMFGLSCLELPKSAANAQYSAGDHRYLVVNAENRQLIQFGPQQWFLIANPEAAERQWSDLVGRDGFAERSDDYWNLLCVLNGIPTLATETTETFIPQMINLDALGGISFNKGCYTGQEIVARMHFLGKLKRRMILAAMESARLPTPGEPVFVEGSEQSVGQVVNAAYLHNTEIRLLAVLQIDQIRSKSIHLSGDPASTFKVLELPYTF
jgi:tRNA-modifying protein YgfZ